MGSVRSSVWEWRRRDGAFPLTEGLVHGMRGVEREGEEGEKGERVRVKRERVTVRGREE